MGGDEKILIERFLSGLAHQRVVDFIGAVINDETLTQELLAIDMEPESVAVFARQKGYGFTADDLSEVIESRVSKSIPGSEQALRARLRADRGNSPGVGVSPADRETDATLFEVDHGVDFVLDREAILRGDVLALRQVPALPNLLTLMEESLDQAFEGTDLEEIHLHHDFEDMKARAAVAYARLSEDGRIPGAVQAIVEDLGLNPEDVLWERPGMRLLFPVEFGGRGVYRTANSGVLAAHRDTWYGSPIHQINLWGPVRHLDSDATLRILPRYFAKSVANTSRGYDTWQNRLGLAMPPSIRARVNAEGAFAPPLEIGDVLCFAGQQLHASAANRSGRTRVSFEFRLLHRDDVGRDYVPVNNDYYGIGEIYRGWFNQRGEDVDRLTGEPVSI